MPPMMTQLVRQGALPLPFTNVGVYLMEPQNAARSEASIHRVAVRFNKAFAPAIRPKAMVTHWRGRFLALSDDVVEGL